MNKLFNRKIKKMLFIIFLLSVTDVIATGELTILYSPASLQFIGSEALPEIILVDLFSASLGLSINESLHNHRDDEGGTCWKGLLINNPFNVPEAVVEIYVDGVNNISTNVVERKIYPLIVDKHEPDTFDIIKYRIAKRFPDGRNQMVSMRLFDEKEINTYSHIFGDIKIKPGKYSLDYLSYNLDKDYNFLSELEVLKAITAKVNSGVVKTDNRTDFYEFRFHTLFDLSNYHGASSNQTSEAKFILNKALGELRDAFVKTYNGAVLVTVAATDVSHARRIARAAYVFGGDESTPHRLREHYIRQDEATPTPTNGTDTGTNDTDKDSKSAAIDPDLPLRANLLLWFTLIYFFALFGTVYLIMSMEPDQDSIIYRLTNIRTKKEN